MALIDLPSGGIALDDLIKSAILQALARSNWVQIDAAKLLHLTPRQMCYQVRKYQIPHPNGQWGGRQRIAHWPPRSIRRHHHPKLTTKDVTMIRDEAHRYARLSPWQRAKRIAGNANGLWGSAVHILEIIRGHVRVGSSVLLLLWPMQLGAQTAVFEPSEDHAWVTSYQLEVARVDTGTIVRSLELGKPAWEIRVPLTGLPPQTYVARARAFKGTLGSEPAVSAPFTVAQALDCTALVTRIYLEELCRAPDEGGLKAWVSACQAGNTEAAIRGAFRSSAEYATVPHPCPSSSPPAPEPEPEPAPESPPADPVMAELAKLRADLDTLRANLTALIAALHSVTVPAPAPVP